MLWMHDCYDRIAESLYLSNVVVRLGLKGDGNVALLPCERGQGFDASSNMDLVSDPRVSAAELMHRAIQQTRDCGLDAEYPHNSTAQLLQIINLRLKTFEVPHRRVRLQRECLAGCG